MLMAHVLALICATSSPGTMRNKSGILVAPDRRMSSGVMTKTAEAVRESGCSVFATEVTRIFIKSSRLASERSLICCPPDSIVIVTSINKGKALISPRVSVRCRYLIRSVPSEIKVCPRCRSEQRREPRTNPGGAEALCEGLPSPVAQILALRAKLIQRIRLALSIGGKGEVLPPWGRATVCKMPKAFLATRDSGLGAVLSEIR